MMNSCIYDELLYLTLPKRMFKNVFLLLRHYFEFFDFRNVVKQLRTRIPISEFTDKNALPIRSVH